MADESPLEGNQTISDGGNVMGCGGAWIDKRRRRCTWRGETRKGYQTPQRGRETNPLYGLVARIVISRMRSFHILSHVQELCFWVRKHGCLWFSMYSYFATRSLKLWVFWSGWDRFNPILIIISRKKIFI